MFVFCSAPVDLCAVVDVSGSMCTEASLKNEQGKSEAHGLCLLDIVKHAVRTIGCVLNENDRLSIVSYSDQAKCEMPLVAMDKSGKVRDDGARESPPSSAVLKSARPGASGKGARCAPPQRHDKPLGRLEDGSGRVEEQRCLRVLLLSLVLGLTPLV